MLHEVNSRLLYQTTPHRTAGKFNDSQSPVPRTAGVDYTKDYPMAATLLVGVQSKGTAMRNVVEHSNFIAVQTLPHSPNNYVK